jgi:hypothetical protein
LKAPAAQRVLPSPSVPDAQNARNSLLNSLFAGIWAEKGATTTASPATHSRSPVAFQKHARMGYKSGLFARRLQSLDAGSAGAEPEIVESLRPFPRKFPLWGDDRRRPGFDRALPPEDGSRTDKLFAERLSCPWTMFSRHRLNWHGQVAEPQASQILIDLISFGRLTGLRCTRPWRTIKSDRHGAPRMGHVNWHKTVQNQPGI